MCCNFAVEKPKQTNSQMKKLLLSLCTAALALSASAAEYTVNFADLTSLDPAIDASEVVTNKGYSLVDQTQKAGEVTILFELGDANAENSFPRIWKTTKGAYEVRWYNKNVITFSVPEEYTITEMAFEGGKLNVNKENVWSTGTCEKTTWTATEPTSKVVYSPSATDNITKITFTYESSDAPVATLPAPVLKLVQGEYAYAVEMTCEDADAKIYYTTDGTEPSASEYLYDEPVDVWFATTFKAIAIKGDEQSKVTTFVANPPLMLEGFDALVGMEADMVGDGLNVEISGDMRVIYQNGDYTYATSGWSNMLIYGKDQPTLENGDTFTSLDGLFKLYNGMPEITNPKYGEITPATAESKVSPRPAQLDMVSDNMMCQYLSIADVEISGLNMIGDVDGETYTVALYNRFKIDIPEGKGFSVVGFVAKFNETLQFYPIEITGGVVMEQVAAPVIEPVGGELEAGATITITCATADAKIYYTTDGTEPSAESTLYTAPIAFTEAMTVKAIAIAEGMLDSEAVSASFTLRDPNAPEEQEATFDFTDPESLGVEIPEVTKDGIEVTSLKSGIVTLTSVQGDGYNTPNRFWLSNNAWELRTYEPNTLTVEVPETYALEKLEFTSKSKVSANWSEGSCTDNVWTPEAGKSTNSVTFSTKANIYTLKVTYKSTSGVADAAVDADAAVEYYNLQGVRIQGDLTPGLYIRRQGTSTSKVIIR